MIERRVGANRIFAGVSLWSLRVPYQYEATTSQTVIESPKEVRVMRKNGRVMIKKWESHDKTWESHGKQWGVMIKNARVTESG